METGSSSRFYTFFPQKPLHFGCLPGAPPAAPADKAEREQPLSRALATPCLKPASKWHEWHIIQGNKITRTKRAKITSADDEHMKGK